jgi:hypothetical protein
MLDAAAIQAPFASLQRGLILRPGGAVPGGPLPPSPPGRPRLRGALRGDLRSGMGYGAVFEGKDDLAKPNYQYEKRQRELAKKHKKADKAARKASGKPDDPSDEPGIDAPADEATAQPDAGQPGTPGDGRGA